MKKFLILFFLILIPVNIAFAQTYTTSDMKIFASKNNKFYGLQNTDGDIIVKANYKKLIRLGNNAWIAQKRNNKYGVIDCNGNILVSAKYSHAERIFDKLVKLGNDKDYGLYDEFGTAIIPPKFKAIEPLLNKLFLTYRNHKYGIYSITGKELLANEYDFIYKPSPRTLRIKKGLHWYEIEKISNTDLIDIPITSIENYNDENIKVTEVFFNTGVGVSYGIVTTTDYTLKIISSLSRAYEDTIDELMFSKGLDSIPIIMNFSWIPKFPFVYAKKYYNNLTEPNNGPLSGVRNDLIEKIK